MKVRLLKNTGSSTVSRLRGELNIGSVFSKQFSIFFVTIGLIIVFYNLVAKSTLTSVCARSYMYNNARIAKTPNSVEWLISLRIRGKDELICKVRFSEIEYLMHAPHTI